MNKPDYLPIAPLIPRFAWCMLPLALANVLLNNLLARAQFKVVPWTVLIAVAYAMALIVFGGYFKSGNHFTDFKSIVLILGVFNIIFLGVLILFTWTRRAS